MGSLITDETGTYSIKEDGSREYATPVSAKINDEEIYTFDSEKGLLRLSMSPEDVENLRQSFKVIYLGIPDPLGLGRPARFKEVKSIESLPQPADGNYLMSGARPQQRKTLFGRVRNYFN